MFCYIHIPFCESKCAYCRFASFSKIEKFKIDKYVNFLCNEIYNYEISKLTYKNGLKSIYFGGGTPSVLSRKQLDKIIKTLKNKFGFSSNIEITLESTPNNISENKLYFWEKLGVNRLSMGIQSLNKNTLKEIGRDINPLKNFSLIKQSNLQNISIDFIIGLPYVKKGEVKNDILYVLDNYDFIKHISVYMLEDYYYPGNWAVNSIEKQDYFGEYIQVKDFLEKKGFKRYEISNYAKRTYECSHNKAYWNHSEVIAFGLGASSFINNTRAKNSDNFKSYYLGNDYFSENLSEEDIFLEKIMFGLRTSGLEKSVYKKLNLDKIKFFIENGYFKMKNSKLILENKGILFLDYLIKEII